MKWILALLLWGAAAPVMAQSVYKCRDEKGQPVYQSDPCPNAEKRWDTPANVAAQGYTRTQLDAEAKIEADRQHMRARAQQMAGSSVASGTVVRGRDASQCDYMRRQRDEAYKAMGTNRSFEASRRWDNAVWEACK